MANVFAYQGLVAKYKKVVENLPPQSCVLDIGCNNGRFGRILTGFGHSVIGIDKDKKATHMEEDARREWL